MARPPIAIDVLIVVALHEELEAVLAEGPGAWEQPWEHVHTCTIASGQGGTLIVAAVWTGAMGSTATAVRATEFIEKLAPSCIAMCGICAGKRGDVSLGDLIVADRVYSFDYGKLVAAENGTSPPAFFHDLTTYNLERSWQMDATAFRRDLTWASHLLPKRPPSAETQASWLLHKLYAHEHENGTAPLQHSERAQMFRTDLPESLDWAERIKDLRKQGFLGDSGLRLTELGRKAVEEDRLLHQGIPPASPFRVHIGPIATVTSVVQDPKIFDRLKRVERKTLGLEMEASAIGYVGDVLPRRAIIAKAVSDYADHDKDDRFREFACRASAAWLFAFLSRHLAPQQRPASVQGSSEPSTESGPRSPFPDLLVDRRAARDGGVSDDSMTIAGELQRRVERALALRHPDARSTWKRGPDTAHPMLRAFLEVRLLGGGYTKLYPVAIIDGEVGRPVFESFFQKIVNRYRADTPFIEPLLVHTGSVPGDVAAEARRWHVRLESLLELQGLLDFRPYVAEQRRVLERDVVYPSKLYVPQRITYRLGLDDRADENALEVLDTWLSHEGPQLVLVLGDFGTGKTFLMHQLAQRLCAREGAVIPILIELRKLEKSRSLDALLGQHFIPEHGMKRFDHAAFHYMLEEGRIVLLFDGFDELALRVTYEAAAEHLDTVLQAAVGNAKVVLTSRTQHFINDQQILQALGERVTRRGFRMSRLLPFDKPRIQQFLANRFEDDDIARQWFELLGEVKDLLGLSHNPRMLGFIAEIPEQDLRRAAEGGQITSATLYRVLLERWLGHEVQRDHPPGMETGLSVAPRWKAATELARLLWPRKDRSVAVSEIPQGILDEVDRLAARPLGRDAVAFKVGSGTLLTRDEEGRFSFIHQSVVEWLIANDAAESLRESRQPVLLARAEMSDLMADFFWGLAGREAALDWAEQALAAPTNELLAANANRLLQRLRRGATGEAVRVVKAESVIADMRGQTHRGRDFSGAKHLRGAMMEAADVSDASFARADLTSASMTRAVLRGANLERAVLRAANLERADLSHSRLLGADLTGAKFEEATLRYASFVGASSADVFPASADIFGAAPARPERFDVVTALPRLPCRSIAWSADGALLAAGYRDGILAIWAPASGTVLRTMDSNTDTVRSIAFSHDGRMLAASSIGNSVGIWNTETGARVFTLEGHTKPVTSLVFSPDGSYLASGSLDRTIRFWERRTGELKRVLKGHSQAVNDLAFHQNFLASSSNDGTIRLWDAHTGILARTLEAPSAWIQCLAFSVDGKLLAAGSNDNLVRLWDPQTGQVVRMLKGHSNWIVSVAFSPDGQLVASASLDNTVGLWNPHTGAQVRTLEGHTDWVNDVAFSADGMLASASDDKTTRIWTVHASASLRSLAGESLAVRALAFSADDQLLASGGSDNRIRVWNPLAGRLIESREGHTGTITAVSFSRNGLLASGSMDTTVRTWRTGSRYPRVLEGHSNWVTSVAFSIDGQILASSSIDDTIRLWNPFTGKMIRIIACQSRGVTSIAFSSDGLLASGSLDQGVRIWKPDTGNRIWLREGHKAPISCLAFSPDGALVASGAKDKSVRLWKVSNGDLRHCFEGHRQRVTCVAFSPDGQIIASGSCDKSIRFWSPHSPKLLRVLDGHAHTIESVAFSHDGKFLASGSNDNTIRLWSVSAALRGDKDACVAVTVAGRGWATLCPDGRYKLGGETVGLVSFTVGLCGFLPGVLDTYPEAFEHGPHRVADEEVLITLDN